ncbi:zinc finger protein [Macleaya cordata]|uniref:Zinc finger protein n=1 Tax=Macleaya cordata TaxID=56857 RepID=A0A200R820_MACCD|nr:zinc finger protein [Macleaya cordata]
MGGNGASGSRQKFIASSSCQICNLASHHADSCPFIYSACKRDKCNGIRKMLTSNTKANPGKRFLTCQYSGCRSFQWLDEAITESISTCSTPKQHISEGCFECGGSDHWYNECPWVRNPCRKDGCVGIRKLKISGKKWSDGEKFLRCNLCEDFEWLKDVKKELEITPKSPINARIVIEANLCEQFKKGCGFKNK